MRPNNVRRIKSSQDKFGTQLRHYSERLLKGYLKLERDLRESLPTVKDVERQPSDACPFCGGEPEELKKKAFTIKGEEDRYLIRCKECLSSTPKRSYLKDARQMWKQRVSP